MALQGATRQTITLSQSVRGPLHNLAATCFNPLPAATANQHKRSLGANCGESLDVAKPSFQTKHNPEEKKIKKRGRLARGANGPLPLPRPYQVLGSDSQE